MNFMKGRHFIQFSAVVGRSVYTTHAFASKVVITRVETEFGSFDIAIDPAVAPITVANYFATQTSGRHGIDGAQCARFSDR